jgi:hypothetical protein
LGYVEPAGPAGQEILLKKNTDRIATSMKSLSDVGVPARFVGTDDYNSETDEEERKFYESFMLETELGFDDAVAVLGSFIALHYGTDQKTSIEDVVGVRSWAAITTLPGQEITAQLTDFGDYCGGYLRSVADLDTVRVPR